MNNNTVLSGMRPTGRLHLGHYHGVLKNWAALQNEYDCFFCVADWHALTTHYSAANTIAKNSRELVIDWLAAGIDPNQSTFFIQSQVPEHSELYLLLAMVTPLGWLERVPSFKEQRAKLSDRDLSTYGFLGYPVLQAADILVYRAAHVPVGKDQVPHVELTREIARRFNYFFAADNQPILPEPHALLTLNAKMAGLDGQKMSKSYGNTIALRDDANRVQQKIAAMPTDPARVRLTDPGDPKKCPAYSLHKAYSDADTLSWVEDGCRAAKFGCVECKKPLIKKVTEEQQQFYELAEPYTARPDLVQDIIQAGNKRARTKAAETMQIVRDAVGIIDKKLI